MNAKNLMGALNGVDYALVEEAEAAPKARKQPWKAWAAAAACVVLAVGIGLLAFTGWQSPQKDPGPRDTSNGRWSVDSRYLVRVSGETAMAWPWEYKTPMERYEAVTWEGQVYRTRGREIREALLGEELGRCEAEGYDPYTETRYPARFRVRAIQGVDPGWLTAVELEGTWVVFLRSELPPPATLGEWMDACSLEENLRLERFDRAEGYQITGWYLTASNAGLWQILSECRDAPCVISDGWNLADRRYLTFTATSEALGAYKLTFTVTEDGYLLTNLLDYGYTFEIGAEAAGRFLQAALADCTETQAEPYYPMLAGVLTEIGEGYVLVDDTALCAKEADGLVYRVLTEDLRARRCLEFPGDINLGDFVVVEYSGTIDEANGNTVTGAFHIAEAILDVPDAGQREEGLRETEVHFSEPVVAE